jgi:dTMP kinase
MERGMFIVLEGADGSGKTTQFNLLSERLQAVGYEVAVFDFPRYGEPSSHFIQSYLNGGYGPASQVSPYTASLFYALDRYESRAAISKALTAGKIVLSNRFVGSNMAHQGSKFTNIAERRGFFVWEDSLEFELLGIPRPDLNIFLRVPAEISYKLVGKKNARSYTDKKHDEHEGDINHLRQTVETYGQLCKLFPKDFKLIECTKNGKILSIPQINNNIWEIIKPFLPKPQNKPQKRTIHLDKSEPEQQPAVVHKVAVSALAGKNELLKVNLKAISLLESRRVLKYLDTNSKIVFPKRANPQLLFMPAGMTGKLTKTYQQVQEKILFNYNAVTKAVGVDLAQAVLPLSYLVNIHLEGDSLQWLKLHLDLDEYPATEARQLSPLLTKHLCKRWPAIFKKLSTPAMTDTESLSEFLDKAGSQSSDLNSVSLINIAPRNELDILVDAMYANSDLSRSEIVANLDSLSYQQKSDTLAHYLKIDSVERETLLGKISYGLDLMTSGIELSSLLGLDIFDNIQIQPATPRFGYDVPDKVDGSDMCDAYLDCFDLSLGLYSELQSAGLQYDAQYAVLLGSRQRWHGVLNARGFIKLRQVAIGASDERKKIVKAIEDSILEVHPIIATNLINLSAPIVISKQRNKSKPKNQGRSSNKNRTR